MNDLRRQIQTLQETMNTQLVILDEYKQES